MWRDAALRAIAITKSRLWHAVTSAARTAMTAGSKPPSHLWRAGRRETYLMTVPRSSSIVYLKERKKEEGRRRRREAGEQIAGVYSVGGIYLQNPYDHDILSLRDASLSAAIIVELEGL